jgi:hypothetical protein
LFDFATTKNRHGLHPTIVSDGYYRNAMQYNIVQYYTYAIQQPILFGFNVLAHRHQIVAGVLVGGDRQDFHRP